MITDKYTEQFYYYLKIKFVIRKVKISDVSLSKKKEKKKRNRELPVFYGITGSNCSDGLFRLLF